MKRTPQEGRVSEREKKELLLLCQSAEQRSLGSHLRVNDCESELREVKDCDSAGFPRRKLSEKVLEIERERQVKVKGNWGNGVELKLKLIKGGGCSSKGVGYCRCSSKKMSKEYYCYSSTCRRNETHICHCGQRSVMRTANTVKNRGKHFWGCSKYKYGVQDDGCNFFKWCTDVGSEDNGRYMKSEWNKETLVNTEELESTRKMMVKIQKSVFFLEKCMKG
ncbi:hypothetical protein V8G54_037853 (chloroplast) [Vigna mungo]|uniref:GRF-type domain-containing protein n=1 Tax=Vigna mungo TaxID=3915 RepID=A0AAQ3RBS4_VIGMU